MTHISDSWIVPIILVVFNLPPAFFSTHKSLEIDEDFHELKFKRKNKDFRLKFIQVDEIQVGLYGPNTITFQVTNGSPPASIRVPGSSQKVWALAEELGSVTGAQVKRAETREPSVGRVFYMGFFWLVTLCLGVIIFSKSGFSVSALLSQVALLATGTGLVRLRSDYGHFPID